MTKLYFEKNYEKALKKFNDKREDAEEDNKSDENDTNKVIKSSEKKYPEKISQKFISY